MRHRWASTRLSAADVAATFSDALPWVCDLPDADATAEAAASVERLDALVHLAGEQASAR